MTFEIRLPQITATSEYGQLAQIKSYLFQLAQALQYTVDNVSHSYEAIEAAVKQQNAAKATPAEEAQTTFAEIKSLIIKSADIVDAYYDEINTRLEGIYVAQSDFGTYTEETAAILTEQSTRIAQNYSNIQTITSDLDTVENQVLSVNAHIITGLLYEDASGPVYGVEVGQRNVVNGVEVFNKYARFTSSKLSFYDNNDIEVAYISNYKLYITNAEVTGNMKIGHYKLDTSNGLAFIWES